MKRLSRHRSIGPVRAAGAGFTLIELMIVVAVLGAIAALAMPSFRQMIVEERLRGVHAQLVTDLNFTRTEAVSRGRYIDFRVQRDATTGDSCYIIFERPGTGTNPGSSGSICNCFAAAGSRCSSITGLQEVRTVSLRAADGVQFSDMGVGSAPRISVEPRTGAIFLKVEDLGGVMPQPFEVQTRLIGSNAILRARMALSGQVTSCVPSGSTMKGSAC